MAKRSNFERIAKDNYPTPYKAILPLLPFLRPGQTFIEPCAGDGRMIRYFEKHDLRCIWGCDIEPRAPGLAVADARRHRFAKRPDMFITNPPWTREILHPIIRNLSDQAPCWLLFDSDWAFTDQSRDLIRTCTDIVAVGRVRWIEGSSMDGKENAAWFRFKATHSAGPHFHGRGTVSTRGDDDGY